MSVVIVEAETMSSHWTQAPSVLASELWISFAGLLRSHVAMRSIAEPNTGWQSEVNNSTSLVVGVSGRRLRVTAPEGSHSGEMDWLNGQSDMIERFGTISFAEDGQIFLVTPPGSATRETMEMEAAVEWLLDEVRMRGNR